MTSNGCSKYFSMSGMRQGPSTISKVSSSSSCISSSIEIMSVSSYAQCCFALRWYNNSSFIEQFLSFTQYIFLQSIYGHRQLALFTFVDGQDRSYGSFMHFMHGVPCSKPLSGSIVDSAFRPSGVDKMSTRNFWGLSGKQ